VNRADFTRYENLIPVSNTEKQTFENPEKYPLKNHYHLLKRYFDIMDLGSLK